MYYVLQIGQDPEVVASNPPIRNSPRIGEFNVEDGNNTYYIFVEQMVLCELSSFSKALFIWFSVHYVFHLSYCSPLNDLCMFLQEFVFGLPSAGGKRSASYLTIVTDIQRKTIR